LRIETRLGTFGDVLDRAPQHAATLTAIRDLVAEMHPDACETASKTEGSVWWGWGPAKNSQGYAWAMPHSTHVNFGFMKGAHLPDPTGLLGGTGKNMRHLKLTGADDLSNLAIRALIEIARDERRGALTN
jgi:hypothetical protein